MADSVLTLQASQRPFKDILVLKDPNDWQQKDKRGQ